MIAAQTPPAEPALEDDIDEAEAQRLAVRMTEDLLDDPLRGAALLRAASMLQAYLAFHDPQPASALLALLEEHIENATASLSQMTEAAPAARDTQTEGAIQ